MKFIRAHVDRGDSVAVAVHDPRVSIQVEGNIQDQLVAARVDARGVCSESIVAPHRVDEQRVVVDVSRPRVPKFQT